MVTPRLKVSGPSHAARKLAHESLPQERWELNLKQRQPPRSHPWPITTRPPMETDRHVCPTRRSHAHSLLSGVAPQNSPSHGVNLFLSILDQKKRHYSTLRVTKIS